MANRTSLILDNRIDQKQGPGRSAPSLRVPTGPDSSVAVTMW
jgi:hypothetical protein